MMVDGGRRLSEGKRAVCAEVIVWERGFARQWCFVKRNGPLHIRANQGELRRLVEDSDSNGVGWRAL